MKIQFLNGGLANQAFQYIFARYYELSHPGKIMYLDDTYFAINTVHNGYELEKVFGIKAHMLSECFDETVWNFIIEEKKKGKSVPQIFCENQIDINMLSEVGKQYRTFNPFDGHVFYVPANQYSPDILELPGSFYYHGYWINKNWFAKYQDTFLQEFQFPDIVDEKNSHYREIIKNSNSLSIHIRRGDYVSLGIQTNPDVYYQYIKYFLLKVPGQWHLFVFSDDIDWCKSHEEELGFHLFREITYIEGNVQGKNYIDMQLMSMCKAMIVSNSSFCYLSALLNVEKKYIVNMSSREL